MTTLDARVSTGLYGHNKIKKLIRRVGYEGPWRLIGLWLYARQHRPDGDLTSMSTEDIEIQVDWAGAPGAFVQALLEAGWLDGSDGTYRLHDWADHQPWAAGQQARKDSAKLAGLIRQYGDGRGREMFHADQARRSESAATRSVKASAALTDSLANPSEALASRSPDSEKQPSPSPFRLLTKEKKDGAVARPAPEGVDPKAWADFCQHRKTKRAPLTDRAVELLTEKLAEYRRQGVDSKAVLNFAIESGHTGLFYRNEPRRPGAPRSGAGELGAKEFD